LSVSGSVTCNAARKTIRTIGFARVGVRGK
jgi:hypothetical protein